MSELLVTIINASTNEVTERPFTEKELADYAVIVANIKASEDAEKAKASAKASALAKLAALGLTEAEIAAL